MSRKAAKATPPVVVDGRPQPHQQVELVVAGTGPWRSLGSLALAILIWLPTGKALLHGDVDTTLACVRFLVAVGVSWVGLGIVGFIVRGYVSAPVDGGAGAAGAADDQPRRRRSDGTPDPTGDAGPLSAAPPPIEASAVETVP